jgi:predicted DNA-binding transcriptional regulator AlpA
MKLERIARMPDWPARMDEVMAADYLGVGVTTFRDRVRAKQYPQAVREGGRVLWSRRQLDEFVAAQFGIATASEVNSWDDSR